MLAFSNDYYGMIFRATQSVELFCAYVISSDEYAGVREHVITNFINFLAKFDVENLYIQNPPLQISEQIIRLYPKAEVKYQKYKQLTTSHLLKINEEY